MKRQFLKQAFVLLAGLAIGSVWQTARAEYNPKLLRIGFQKSASLLTLLKAQGAIEKRLTAQGLEVKWVEFEELQKQGQWINRNYPQAAGRLAPLQGLEPAIVEQSIRRYSNVVKPITGAVLAEQQKLADTFFELKLIPKPIKVRDATLPGKL